jgi:hypothetical protein
MSLGGQVFEKVCSGPAKPRWQLRIPLSNAQYVNFGRDFDSDMNPLVLSAFVEAVQRGLEARGRVSQAEVIQMPAAATGRYYANGLSSATSELERLAR